MSLTKTITLPADPHAAQSEFHRLLTTTPFVFLVVLGNGPKSQELAHIADQLAGGDFIDSWRRVIWAQNPAPIIDVLRRLPAVPVLPPISGGTAGVSISIEDKVCDLLENDIRRGRVAYAFISAEAN
jgi:hypothetical protein